MKIWTLQEEADRLKARFETVNRAAFARDQRVKGGQAMIYQHITGRRPISLEAAFAYANGFECSLEEISPRLYDEMRRASLLSAGREASDESAGNWPFTIPFANYDALSPEKKAQLNDLVEAFLVGAAPAKSAKPKKAA